MPKTTTEKQLWDAIQFDVEHQMYMLSVKEDHLDEFGEPEDNVKKYAEITISNIQAELKNNGYKLIKINNYE